MTPAWVTVLTFMSTSLFVAAVASAVYAGCFRYRLQLDERMRSLHAKTSETPSTALFKDRGRLSEQQAGLFSWARLEEFFDQAHLSSEFSTFCRITFAVTCGSTVIVLLITNRWWTIPLVLVCGTSFPAMYAVFRRRKRKRELMSQLPKALEVISRAVRAGQTVPASFQIVADDFESPIADEFRLCYEQQNLGIPYENCASPLGTPDGTHGVANPGRRFVGADS